MRCKVSSTQDTVIEPCADKLSETMCGRARRSHLSNVSGLFSCRRYAHGGARRHPEERQGAPSVRS